MRFRNRHDAGQQLGTRLAAYAGQPDLLVLGLPRGGVPVAYEVAVALGAPLDVFIVRKLGAPGQEELAMGAIASGGVRVLNLDVIEGMSIPDHVIERVTAIQQTELARREAVYRQDRPPLNARGKTVIVVDDGLATGSTMRAAIAALRALGPARIVMAVPTAAPIVCQEFRALADEVVCLITPEPFHAVGLWYLDFAPTSDEEVIWLLVERREI